MERVFKETKRFDSDFYVGDYTQYAKTHTGLSLYLGRVIA